MPSPRIKPKPSLPMQTFAGGEIELSVSPYLVGEGNKVWEEGVNVFWHWLWKSFGDRPVADYEVAARLDVHRVIVDEWTLGLMMQHLVTFDVHAPFGPNGNALTRFRITKPDIVRHALVDASKLQAFDPWVDRTYDAELDNAMRADQYIDKYFDAFIDEYFLHARSPRIRDNRYVFQPISVSEHPRYAGSHKSKAAREGAPAPYDWRTIIHQACNGDKSKRPPSFPGGGEARALNTTVAPPRQLGLGF